MSIELMAYSLMGVAFIIMVGILRFIHAISNNGEC